MRSILATLGLYRTVQEFAGSGLLPLRMEYSILVCFENWEGKLAKKCSSQTSAHIPQLLNPVKEEVKS